MRLPKLILSTENILNSNDFSKHLEFLLAQARKEEPEPKVLSLLMLFALVRLMKGDHRVEASLKIIDLVEEKIAKFSDIPKLISFEQVFELSLSFVCEELISPLVYFSGKPEQGRLFAYTFNQH